MRYHVGLVTLKRPLLRLLDGLVYSGPAFAYNCFWALCLNWMDSLTRWTWVTPRFQVAVSDSINLRLIDGCLLTISKVILTYFAPEILNQTHILWLGGKRSASWSCSGTSSWWPVWHDDMAYCHPLTERIGSRPSGIDLSPRTSAVYRCINFGHIDSSIDNVQLHYEPCSTRS